MVNRASVRAESQDAILFRVVTYNIHKGIGGLDRRYRPARITEAITEQDPDIVLMQEVDEGVPRSNSDCQVEMFAAALDMKYTAYQRNVQLKRGYYGNAILSRFPLADIRHIDLSIPFKKRRRAILAHCRLMIGGHQRTLVIANLHLGLAEFERILQLNKMVTHDLIAHTHSRTPMIIGGDYNDVWNSLGKRVMQPSGFEAVGQRIQTFPAAMPARPLDHMYFRGDLRLDHAFAGRSKVARVASDHLPLVADFWVCTESH